MNVPLIHNDFQENVPADGVIARWRLRPSLPVLFFGAFACILLCGCGFHKPILKDLEESAPGIGQQLSTGLIAGVESAKLDSIVEHLMLTAGVALNERLDEVSLNELKEELNGTLREVIVGNLDSVKTFLADTTILLPLETKLELVVAGLLEQMNGTLNQTLSGALPRFLSPPNQRIVLNFRDSLLGPQFSYLLSMAVKEGIGDLAQSEELDSLLRHVNNLVDDTKVKVDDTAFGISKTVRSVVIGVGGLLLALSLLFFTLWFRKRSQAKDQKELLVNLTKAIDAIPSQREYDKTIEYLQEKTSLANKQEQKVLLDQVLKESRAMYPEKRKYQSFNSRMIERLREIDRDGTVRRQLLDGSEEQDFESFVMNNESHK